MTSFETETRREDDARCAARVEGYMGKARAFAALLAVSDIETIAGQDSPAGAIAEGLIEMDRTEVDGWTVATLDPDLLTALWMADVLAIEPVRAGAWIAWDGLGVICA